MSENLESLGHLLTWNELWYHQVGQVDGCWEPRRSGWERGCCPAQPFHTALRPTRRVGDSCPLLLYSFPRRGEEAGTPPPRSLPAPPQPGLVPLVPQSWGAALHLWNVDPNPPGMGSLYSSPDSCPPPCGHPLHHPRPATKWDSTSLSLIPSRGHWGQRWALECDSDSPLTHCGPLRKLLGFPSLSLLICKVGMTTAPQRLEN